MFRFSACRAANEVDSHIFSLDSCQLTDQVINIHTVRISFSEKWNVDDNPPQCHVNATCNTIIDDAEIMNCNGKGNCSFSQTALNYPPCEGSTNANYISIDYNCINGNNNACCLHVKPILFFLYLRHHNNNSFIGSYSTCILSDINTIAKISRLMSSLYKRNVEYYNFQCLKFH